MSDFLIFVVGGLVTAVAYLIATTHRHENALRCHQSDIEQISAQGNFASWDDLNGGKGEGIQE